MKRADPLPGNSPGPQIRSSLRRIRLTWLAMLFMASLLLVVWTSVGLVLGAKRHDAIEAEQRQNLNLARVLGEQTLRVIATIDQALLKVSRSVATHGAASTDMVRIANETGLAPEILIQLSLLDARGRFIGSNLDPDGRKSQWVDLSARAHVRIHLGSASPNPGDVGLFIGEALTGKVSGRASIQLSRGIRDAEGRTIGVVVGSLDPSYFENIFRRVELGRTGAVSLVGADLGIRARVVDGSSIGSGRSVAAESNFAQAISSADAGVFHSEGRFDSVRRITAFQRVSDYPLYVSVGTGLDEALGAWRATRDGMSTLAVILSVAMIAATLLFIQGIRRLAGAYRAVRASELQAQAASQAKSEFIAAMSHDLRTPLTSIRGFAELMEHRLDQPKFREQASLIRKGAEHLNDILTQVLDLSRIETGHIRISQEAVNVREELQSTADFFALAAREKGLSLDVVVADDVPETATCDRLRLRQVLSNLLSNAIKFTRSGGVTLQAEVVGAELHYHVRDTGPGIPADKHALIFEKFRQGDARVSYEHGGSGLGLALAHALAELMKGNLTVSSAPGHGACFTLCLPLASSEVAAAA